MIKNLQSFIRAILISLALPLTAFAASGDRSNYKVKYSMAIQYTDPLGEVVSRDREMTSRDNIGLLLKKSVKYYGFNHAIKRDYSVDNFMKLLPPHEQSALAGTMKENPYYIASIKIDFNKFANKHDLAKLFKSCQEKIHLSCNTKTRTCTISKDEIVCDPIGYAFEDISTTSNNYGISLKLAEGQFRKTVTGMPFENFNLLIIENGRSDGLLEGDGEQQQKILDKLKSLLPETSIITHKEESTPE